jgi:hypothetical protein
MERRTPRVYGECCRLPPVRASGRVRWAALIIWAETSTSSRKPSPPSRRAWMGTRWISCAPLMHPSKRWYAPTHLQDRRPLTTSAGEHVGPRLHDCLRSVSALASLVLPLNPLRSRRRAHAPPSSRCLLTRAQDHAEGHWWWDGPYAGVFVSRSAAQPWAGLAFKVLLSCPRPEQGLTGAGHGDDECRRAARRRRVRACRVDGRGAPERACLRGRVRHALRAVRVPERPGAVQCVPAPASRRR